jgi:hypothetical protein
MVNERRRVAQGGTDVVSAPTLSRHSFRIDGPLLGYRASARAAFDPRYRGFKNMVRVLADVAGVPYNLEKGDKAEVFVKVYWIKKARIDTSNVLKSLEDGLFKQDRGIVAVHCIREEHTGKEYADVEVVVERGASC